MEITEQIGLSPAIITKFDLLIPIRDAPGAEHDRLIVESILKKHLRGNALKMDNGDLKNEILNRTDDLAPVYSEEFIRRYVAYARLHCNPTWQESVSDMIVDEYSSLKKTHDRINVLNLETIVRLTEASARSRLSDTVDENDVKKSVSIVRNYMVEMNLR